MSWGEKVTCEVTAQSSGSVVTVTSRSAVPTQVIDWGVHRKNIAEVFAALKTSLASNV